MYQQDGVYPLEWQCFLTWSEPDNSLGGEGGGRILELHLFSFLLILKHLNFVHFFFYKVHFEYSGRNRYTLYKEICGVP